MKTPYSDDQEKLARFAKAMGHPARIKILEILSDRGCCYSGNIADENIFLKLPVIFEVKPL